MNSPVNDIINEYLKFEKLCEDKGIDLNNFDEYDALYAEWLATMDKKTASTKEDKNTLLEKGTHNSIFQCRECKTETVWNMIDMVSIGGPYCPCKDKLVDMVYIGDAK